MNRISLKNGTWFDRDEATKFTAKTITHGTNELHWNCEAEEYAQHDGIDLYKTKSGNWVLYRWTNYQGGIDEWVLTDASFAKKFLSSNELYDELQEHFPKEIDELEV